MKNFFKKAFVGATTFACGLVALAQDSGGSSVDPIIAVDDFSDMWESIGDTMTDLIEAALPYVTAFVIGGLVLWGAFALIRIIKRGFSTGKGR